MIFSISKPVSAANDRGRILVQALAQMHEPGLGEPNFSISCQETRENKGDGKERCNQPAGGLHLPQDM